jgi:predicted secreted protein
MAAINGTTLLLYSQDNTGANIAFAMQKGLTISIDVDLPDATNKESAHWAQHICGLMNAKIDFDALFSTGLLTDTPKVLGAKTLMDYIINSTSILISILGGPFPIVGQCDMSSINIVAPKEVGMTLAGSFKVNGKLYPLTGTMAQLLTDPDGVSTDYNTFDITGTAITHAVNLADGATAISNTFSVTKDDVIKFITYFTNSIYQVPSVYIIESGGSNVSNVVAVAAGLNIITLTVTKTCTASLAIYNTDGADWVMTPIYLFKV